MLADRDFFFGLYRVKAWDYWWGYTSAQIELMVTDAPLVVYDTDKKDDKGFKKATRKSVSEARKQWEEKYGENGGKSVKLSDILAGK